MELSQLRGAQQAIDEINARGGAAGRELVPVQYDPASDARLFGQHAERMFTQDNINVVFGGYPLTIVEPGLEFPDVRCAAYWHERMHKNPRSRWFRGLLFDTAKDM